MIRKCITKDCLNNSAKHRLKCYTCRSREYKRKYPYKTAFNSLKTNARRRGKDFNLTFQEFKTFCIETDYLNGKGRSKNGFHIDRIDESKGYSIDNIQILSNTENVKKYIKYIGRDENNNPEFTTNTLNNKPKEYKDVPF